MKEDAALALGVSLTALAAQVVWARRVRPVDWWGTSVLGAACAVAASAKFAGTFTVVVCVPLVWVASRPGWRRRASGLAVFAAAFVLVVAAVNHRALHEPGRALATMEREHQHATTRHRAFTMARPNLFHAAAAVRQTMPHVLVLALGFVAYAAARPWGAGGWGVFLAAFMVAYLAVLSWSVLPYYRYALPVVLLAHWLMALAVVRVVQGWAPPRARAAWLATAAVGVVALQLPRCLDYTRQFGDDSRDRLRLWATQHLPADAVFVQDGCVALDAPFDRRTGVTEQPQFLVYGPASYDDAPAASAGLLKDLRRMGVGYVAVSDFAFYRYFDPSVRPAPDSRAVFESRRRWYEELFREHELIWSSVPAHPTHSHFNNPELKLYRLRDPARNGGAK
jgi:hypothetical protein